MYFVDCPTASLRLTEKQIEGKHVIKPQGTQITSLSSSEPSAESDTNPALATTRKKKVKVKEKEEKKKHRQQKPQGFARAFAVQFPAIPGPLRSRIIFFAVGLPTGSGTDGDFVLTMKRKGVTITQAWSTASLLDSKVELTDAVAPGVKIDLQNLWNPSKEGSAAQKVNFAFKNPNVHSRAFVNYATAKGNIDAIVDVVAGSDGFLVGGEAGYDVQKAAVTRYSLGLGYQTPSYVASIVGTQNLTQIAASYYQKVNSAVEVGAKAGYDVQAQKASGLELASKYKLDPLSFAKVSNTVYAQVPGRRRH